MMRRETAYKLAGRKHRHDTMLEDAHSHHDLRFAVVPPGQAQNALKLLQELPHLRATLDVASQVVRVDYYLVHYSLRMIENFLIEHGLSLDDSVMSRVMRSLTHFREETQLRNAASPQRLIKQSNQVYVKAYEHHPHGDEDDTPPELREIK